jgi:hypothetical protein
VNFNPTATGARTAALSIKDGVGTKAVQLSGTGELRSVGQATRAYFAWENGSRFLAISRSSPWLVSWPMVPERE